MAEADSGHDLPQEGTGQPLAAEIQPADPLQLLVSALHQCYQVIERIRPDQLEDPTPCRSWTVRQILDHLLEDLHSYIQRAQGKDADGSAPEPAEPAWARTFRTGSDALISAWRQAGDLSGTITLPGMGVVPKSFPLDQQIAEFATHTWDLASATGQSTDLDPEVGQAALSCVQLMLRPEFRGDEQDGMRFGPEQPIDPGAPIYDRLAAFLGRPHPDFPAPSSD